MLVRALKEKGVAILIEIDVKDTLKKKLGVDFGNYRILVVCNPPFACKAPPAEVKAGMMLPCCNVIVQETRNGGVEIAAINPFSSLRAIDNAELRKIACTIGIALNNAI